ncbi:hypothetical protein [Nocardia sp. NPDC020380]|uniref:hypothetical protein n=1 Tax=Nocardia sp. NPDC020380 TaxID=3364309 RepID=UPI0037A1F1C6
MWNWSRHQSERASAASFTQWRVREPRPTVTDLEPFGPGPGEQGPEPGAGERDFGRVEAAVAGATAAVGIAGAGAALAQAGNDLAQAGNDVGGGGEGTYDSDPEGTMAGLFEALAGMLEALQAAP